MKKIFRSLLAFSFVGVFLLVTPPESQASIAEQPCNQVSWTQEDDVAHEMALPYSLPLGNTTYNTTYVTTNGTLTFGTPNATFSTYPSTPSISLAGWDWVTWNGGHLSYGVTNTGFCVEWKVRPFPQSEGEFTTIKLTVDTSRLPTWSGIVETTGWLPSDLRRGIRFQANEEVITISEAFTINGGLPVEMQTCWDGTIIPMSGTCPAEPPPGQCWDGSTVAYNQTCPPVPPDTQCWNGTWVAWSQTCPPLPQPITCWDGSVIPGTDTCPIEPQVTCWNGSIVHYQSECPPAPTSIVVNSLLDDGSQGTLRWAINQANAQSGGIYDSITFSVEGTINLTSNLPNITGQLSISGEDKVSLFGNYRLYASSGSNVTINDLEFNYTYVENERGTLTINSSYFHNSGRSIFNKNGNTTITYVNNSLFTNNGTAIASDWGGTPSIFSVGDSSYDNRIYVNSSTFENNSTAIDVERTVIVSNSQFNNNGVAISGGGINKHSVLNSSFTGNGVAIQTFSWIPSSWLTFFDNSSVENNNRLIKGNTFTNNSYAIVLDDSYNNGQRTQKGATVRDNSWDESGIWIRWSLWDGTQNVQMTETTLNSNLDSFYSLNNISIAPAPEPSPTPEPTPTPIPEPSPYQAPIENPIPDLLENPILDSVLISPELIETLPIDSPEILEPSLEPTPTQEPIIEPELETDFTEEEVSSFVEDAVSDGSFTEAETEALIENLEADGEISAEEVSNLSDSLTEDGTLTQEDKELLADVLIAQADGEAITSDSIEELGLDYEDLPPEQPVALDNGVILTAEVADAIEIFEDPSELLATVFSDPGKAIKAIANIGADMTIETRKEAQAVTVSAVVVTQIISSTSALALARN